MTQIGAFYAQYKSFHFILYCILHAVDGYAMHFIIDRDTQFDNSWRIHKCHFLYAFVYIRWSSSIIIFWIDDFEWMDTR